MKTWSKSLESYLSFLSVIWVSVLIRWCSTHKVIDTQNPTCCINSSVTLLQEINTLLSIPYMQNIMLLLSMLKGKTISLIKAVKKNLTELIIKHLHRWINLWKLCTLFRWRRQVRVIDLELWLSHAHSLGGNKILQTYHDRVVVHLCKSGPRLRPMIKHIISVRSQYQGLNKLSVGTELTIIFQRLSMSFNKRWGFFCYLYSVCNRKGSKRIQLISL